MAEIYFAHKPPENPDEELRYDPISGYYDSDNFEVIVRKDPDSDTLGSLEIIRLTEDGLVIDPDSDGFSDPLIDATSSKHALDEVERIEARKHRRPLFAIVAELIRHSTSGDAEESAVLSMRQHIALGRMRRGRFFANLIVLSYDHPVRRQYRARHGQGGQTSNYGNSSIPF